ncbi:hypothetical protein V9T40_006074 [Parthenolecanium corni]|uniref:Uncharacterized protein n=1 Tax=Parthenolecanium corni TaxID=536013 RepID=A0AAN9TVC1_9HEMI
MCRKMLIKIANKLILPKYPVRFALLSFIAILAGSIYFEKFKAPQTYFSDVRNPFNLFLMKPSLFITISMVFPFIFITHFPLNNGAVRPTMLPIYRLVFAFLLYFCILMVCRLIGDKYAIGSFTLECDINGTKCWEELERWFPITISGHIFTMLCCALMIAEETLIFGQWKKIEDTIMATEESECCAVDTLEQSKLISRQLFLKYSPCVKTVYLILAFWALFLCFSIFITVAYFHQPYEKIGGAVLAIAHWQLTYRFVCFSQYIADEVKKFEHKNVGRYRTVDFDFS